jgi:hypothetical protein
VALALLAVGGAPSLAAAQVPGVYVVPRRADQSKVRYFDFDWQHLDIEVEVPKPDPPLHGRTSTSSWNPPPTSTATTGKIRLFFYSRERGVAERASAYIEASYKYLVDEFHYVPERTFPYILYSSYQEFLQTNLFPLQEGILGVTSPRDLKLTLPFFGDYRLFQEVSTHEMAHQFTIQKVRSFSRQADLSGDALDAFPLWFVEGLAEYYGRHGIDGQDEMLIRDLLLNPNLEHGYAMLEFFEDRPFSTMWTYKAGQIRCAFLEETYGKGTIQRILETAPILLGGTDDQHKVKNFKELVEQVTADRPERIAAKFASWLKRRAYLTWLESAQDLHDVRPLPEMAELIIGLNASPSGSLLMFEDLDLETGQTRLHLVHRRAPNDSIVVAVDDEPGIESLHPVSPRNFDLDDQRLVFIAEADGADVLYLQEIRAEAAPVKPEKPAPAPLRGSRKKAEPEWKVDLSLGARRRIRLASQGLLAAYSPALSPDGKRVALIGLDHEGRRDVYLVEPNASSPGEDDFVLTRITRDDYGERGLDWNSRGIVFNSDRTEHGWFNLFLADPDGPPEARVIRLTVEERDQSDPVALPDGRILYTAYDHGRSNVYEAEEGRTVRRTDFTTGVFAASPGPDGGLFALFVHGGQRLVAEVPKESLLQFEVTPSGPEGDPRAFPARSLEGSVEYTPSELSNWELDNIFGFLGVGAGGAFGRILFSAADRLRNHTLLVDVFIAGSFELTSGIALYINQSHRLTWGLGPFQSLRFKVDNMFAPLGVPSFFYAQRFYGAEGILQYPLSKFFFLQSTLAFGVADQVLPSDTRSVLADGSSMGNNTGQNLLPAWRYVHRGTHFQSEATLSFGYDTLTYQAQTGPVTGGSFLLETTFGAQPFNQASYTLVRFDAERYFRIYGRTNFFIRLGAGTSLGDDILKPQFFLSSFDTLRGVDFGNQQFLLGSDFLFTTGELQVPLNDLIRVFFLTDIEGIVAVDFGGVSDSLGSLFERRVLDFVLGVNLAFGPIVFRLHFAKPFDIGAPRPNPDLHWVTNFSLGWIYF